jgi:hypothetical protein
MASGGKKKTTMAKLNRESRLRERRLDKQARKDARKYAASHPDEQGPALTGDEPESGADAGPSGIEAVVPARSDD